MIAADDTGVRLRIGLVIDSTTIGGAELAAVELTAAIRDRCEPIAVIGTSAPAELRHRLEDLGVRLEVVDGLSRRSGPTGVARLARRLSDLKLDLIHANCSDQGGGRSALLAGRLLRSPTVATVHLVSPGRGRLREWMLARLLASADRVVAVSSALADQLHERGIDAAVIPNGIAPPRTKPDARRILDPGGSAMLIGGIGRIHDQKGWDVLCAAVGLIGERISDAAYVVVGDGPEIDRLRGDGDCERVRFLGHVAAAARLVGGFDIVVVPSRWEGLGRVPIEAMLSGVPVVASDVGALAEVVPPGGILVPADEPQALAEAIVALARDPARRDDLAVAGRRAAIERFGVEKMASAMESVYRAAVEPAA